jgi:uncharacterized protein YcbK (DUF882 family)
LHDAVANGDTRALTFSHTHRDDQITITFKRNGRYDDDGLKKLNHFLRDWRTDDETRMDPGLFDILWEVHRETGAKEPIRVVSSYRAPATNAMLSRRSNGVARNSLHMQGKAIDFYIPGVPLEELRIAGLRLQKGGVGYYPGSGSSFVHMDVGNVRHWPRMTRDQLARVFPNGRTVHLPTDGKPLAGYELAQADIEKRRNGGGSFMTADAGGGGSLLGRLFGAGKKDEAEEAVPAPAPSRGKPVTVAAVVDKTPEPTKVPLPVAKPTIQLASAPVPPARPARTAAPVQIATTPAGIIEQRGFWQGLPTIEPVEMRQLALAMAKRQQPDARQPTTVAGRMADFETTATVAPWPRQERVPQAALAYAVQPGGDAVARAEPMGATVPSAPALAAAKESSVALKRVPGRNPAVGTAIRAAGKPVKAGDRFDQPWLTALIVTPNTRDFLSTSLMGVPDFHALASLFRKPDSSMVMTFAAEPYADLQSERFTGSAVVFHPTMTFSARTAALR